MVKIFIDPGHGGSDPGAVGNGLQEKSVTLSIAKQIRSILMNEYENVKIKISRTKDVTVSLDTRTNNANKWGADFYLSIHINSGGGTGFESYIYPGVGKTTKEYQEIIHNKTIMETAFQSRGLKQANFHVLRESNMPALLTENGFIDSEDAEKLKNKYFIKKIARGHVNGLAAAFNLQKKVLVPEPEKKPQTSLKGLYRIQIGAFKNQSNAEKLENKAKKNGFQTFIRNEDNLYKVQIGVFTDIDNAEDLAKRAVQSGFKAMIIKE